MTTVYIVTQGDYSDYRIDRIYSTRKAADMHVQAYNSINQYDEKRVEECEVDAIPAEQEGKGWSATWAARYWSRILDREYPENETITEQWLTLPAGTKARVISRTPNSCTVVGYSRGHVEKTLHDTVALIKAQNAGIA